MKRVAALAFVLASAFDAQAYTPSSGFWFNSSESGTGVAIEIEDKTLFMAAYVFDAQGRTTWFTSAGNLTTSASGGATYYNVYNGSLTGFANGQSIGGPYYFPQILTNIAVPQPMPDIADRIAAQIEHSESQLGGAGRVLVRPSGTEALVRVMVEAAKIVRAEIG